MGAIAMNELLKTLVLYQKLNHRIHKSTYIALAVIAIGLILGTLPMAIVTSGTGSLFTNIFMAGVSTAIGALTIQTKAQSAQENYADYLSLLPVSPKKAATAQMLGDGGSCLLASLATLIYFELLVVLFEKESASVFALSILQDFLASSTGALISLIIGYLLSSRHRFWSTDGGQYILQMLLYGISLGIAYLMTYFIARPTWQIIRQIQNTGDSVAAGDLHASWKAAGILTLIFIAVLVFYFVCAFRLSEALLHPHENVPLAASKRSAHIVRSPLIMLWKLDSSWLLRFIYPVAVCYFIFITNNRDRGFLIASLILIFFVGSIPFILIADIYRKNLQNYVLLLPVHRKTWTKKLLLTSLRYCLYGLVLSMILQRILFVIIRGLRTGTLSPLQIFGGQLINTVLAFALNVFCMLLLFIGHFSEKTVKRTHILFIALAIATPVIGLIWLIS